MTVPKKYFHDRIILLLLSINAFLALLACAWILLRLSSGHGSGYIVQYRESVGISAFKTGTVVDMLSFVVFALLVLVAHTILSMRVYHVHRQLSVVTLGLATLLLVITIIVSNALLVLR